MTSQVALILGGSSGIGEASAKRFAKLGYKLAIHGATEFKVNKVVDDCNDISQTKQHLGICMDFSQSPHLAAEAVKKAVNHFGHLDVLVNSVGIFIPTSYSDENIYDTWKQVMTLNVDCHVSGSLEAAKHLKESKNGGSMIFLSSVVSNLPGSERFAYAMAKSAITMFAKCLAVELAPNVRVNIVSPGPVISQMVRSFMDPLLMEQEYQGTTLVDRVGTTNEVAELIEYLVVKGTFLTGTDVVFDGGYAIKNPGLTKPPE